MPLCTTVAAGTMWPQAAAAWALTALKCTGQCGAIWMADSIQGVGGVCSVVTTGTGSAGAIATGR